MTTRNHVLALVALFGIATPVLAQDDLTDIARPRLGVIGSPVGVNLRGFTDKEVLQQFGPPDGKEPTRSGESWRYGQSSILVAGGQVTGWSDLGDLKTRRILRSLRQDNQEQADPGEGDGWETVWRRQKVVAPEDVVDELLAD